MAMQGYDRRINFVPGRNVYPFMMGGSLAQIAGATSDYHATADATTEGIVNQTSTGAEDKPAGNPAAQGKFITWLVLLGLLVLLMFGVQKFGSGEQGSQFANIKLSAFNILVISFAAVIGITFFRLLFTRFYIPNVSEVFNAA